MKAVIFLIAILFSQGGTKTGSVTLYENDIVKRIIGSKAHFTCSGWEPEPNLKIQWYIDETLAPLSQITNHSAVNADEITSSSLVLKSLSKALNNTKITCVVTFPSLIQCNDSFILIVTDLLPGVTISGVTESIDCSFNETICIYWKAPPDSINETLAYTVDVQYGSNLASDNVMNNSYTFKFPRVDSKNASCNNVFSVTVTTNNRLRNRRSSKMDYIIVQNDMISMEVYDKYYLEDELIYELKAKPAICNISVTLNDSSTAHNLLQPSEINVTSDCYNESTIKLHLNEEFEKNIYYDIEYIINENPTIKTSGINNISTHDIQDASINNTFISLGFIRNSKAKGAVLLLLSKMVNAIFVPKEGHAYDLETSAPETTLYIYDVEDNGLLAEGVNYPAIKLELPMPETIYPISEDELMWCENPSCNESVISIKCNCISDTEGYQALLFLGSNNQKGQIHSKSENCSNTLSFPVANLMKENMYQMIIFPIKESTGISNPASWYSCTPPSNNSRIIFIIVGTIVGFTVLFSLLIIPIAVVFICSRQTNRKEISEISSSQNVTMQVTGIALTKTI